MSHSQENPHLEARIAIVREHVKNETLHDLDRVMQTFGATARFDDISASEHFIGHDQVRSNYADFFQGFPDLKIETQEEYVMPESIILEVVISGTHTGSWHGIPPTGKQISFPACAIFSFDTEDKLTGEKVYYDRATILMQLGLMPTTQ
jgi:steroid delta-isomerase-like uncharacterized protein